MADDFGLKIGLEGEKEFKKALSDINQSFKVLGSEMKLVQSQFDKNDNSVEALSARNQVLNREIETQKEKISTLKAALENAASSFGETDRRTQNWQIQLNNAEAALNTMEQELRQNNDELQKAESAFDEAEDQADKFGDEVEDAGKQSDDSKDKFEKLGTVCKAAGAAMAAAFTAVATAAVAAGKALVDMSVEGAAYADGVLTTSTQTGIATDKLQEYMYAAELVDVSTETLTKSMAKQIKSMKGVQDGTALSVEAYDKLGVSVLNADGSLRDSDTVYWEVIDALGKMENETERDALAMQILGKSAQELNPLIEQGAARMTELGEQAHAAGYVISDEMLAAYGALDDQIQYLSVGADAAKNALGTVLLPILTQLSEEGVSLLGDFTNGILEANGDLSQMSNVIGGVLPQALSMIMEYIPEVIEIVGVIIESLGSAIVDNLPAILSSASLIIFTLLEGLTLALPEISSAALLLLSTLLEGIILNLPLLLDASLQVISTLASGIGSSLPTLIPSVVSMVVQICSTLISNLPLILDSALQLVSGLAQGVLLAIPVLLSALPELISSLITFLLEAIPMLIDTGVQLLSSLVTNLPVIIETVCSVLPQLISSLISALLSNIPLIIDAGVQLLISLISNLPSIIVTVISAAPKIVTSLVSAFTSNVGKIISVGVTLLVSLIKNLPSIIVQVAKAAPQIISGLVSSFTSQMSRIAQIGSNIVQGLWSGIQSLKSWLWNKVSAWISSIWDGICDFFGIRSPSREMAWIGEMLVEGLAGSLDNNGKQAVKAAEEMSSDIEDVMHTLAEDMQTALPTDFSVDGSIASGVSSGAYGSSTVSGMTLQLHIDTFNNYTTDDIRQLTNEILLTAGQFAQRKGVVYA